MPVQKALEASGKFLREAAPQLRESPAAPTARDVSNTALAWAITTIVIATLHHGARVDLSPEVGGAIATLMTVILARLFRY